MSLCAFVFSKIRIVNSGDHMVQIMNDGYQLYSNLKW